MNAIIYCRVSSEKQVRGMDYTSLDVQKRECIQYLLEHYPDANLLYAIEDTASAADPNRPGLTRIIQLVQARAVDIIIIYMWSRLVRDPWDSMYLRRLCQQRGIKIRCAKEELVNVFLEQLESEDPMQRWMAETMLFNLDQALKMERLQISKRTKENMRRRVLEGRFPGRRIPFGYKLVDGCLVADPDEAPLVRDAFNLYLQTHSTARVRDYLNLMCPTRRWSCASVRYMLDNPTYTGVLMWDGLRVDGLVEQLIDRQTFALCQQMSRTSSRPVSKRTDFDWYLRGRIWCACGQSMTGYSVTAKRFTPYYMCMGLKYKRECLVKRVNAHRVHEAVVAAVAAVGDAEWLEQMFADGIDLEQSSTREQLEAELAHVRRQIELLSQALAEEGEVRAAVRKLRELEQLERTLREQLLMQSPAARLDLEQIKSTLRQFALAWELMTEAERHEVVTLVVERVQVRRKDAFDVHLLVPDSNGEEAWLPIRRSVRISAKVVAIPREGIEVAEVSLRRET
jgi:site-specific DNA recombinase